MIFARQAAAGGAVTGFRGAGFRIAERDWPGGVLVSARGAEAWNAMWETLAEPDFAPLFDRELILIGTGPTLRRLPPPLSAALMARGIASDAMDSRAAARTYNVLLAEGRLVGAALLALA